MEPIPYSDQGAKLAFDVLIAAFVVLEMRTRVRSRSNQRGIRPRRGSLVALLCGIAAGMAAAFAAASQLESLAIGFARWPLFVAGLALMGAGIAFRQWAIAVLGDSFTIDVRVRPGQPVVERGPYRWVCHPAYSGMIAIFLGIGLTLGNWASLAALAVLPTAALVLRIREEEAALLEELGDPYRRFLASRARLLPGVW